MNFLTAHSLEETSLLAARQVSERLLAQAPHSPSLLLVYFTQAHDAEELRRHLKQQFPTTRLIGCSSCGGVMTQTGHHARQGFGLAVAALYDGKGAYGVAGQAGMTWIFASCCALPSPMAGVPASCPSSSCCTPARARRSRCWPASKPSWNDRPCRGRLGSRQQCQRRLAAVLGRGQCPRGSGAGGALSRLPAGVPVSFGLCPDRASRHHYRPGGARDPHH